MLECPANVANLHLVTQRAIGVCVCVCACCGISDKHSDTGQTSSRETELWLARIVRGTCTSGAACSACWCHAGNELAWQRGGLRVLIYLYWGFNRPLKWVSKRGGLGGGEGACGTLTSDSLMTCAALASRRTVSTPAAQHLQVVLGYM